MKLFYAPGSSSLLPHIVLHEAGLPFEPIKIDEHSKAISGGGDYRNVNPLGYVPALVLMTGHCSQREQRSSSTLLISFQRRCLLLRTAQSKESNYKRGLIALQARCTRAASHRSSTRACQRKAEMCFVLASRRGSPILTGISRQTST